MQYNLKDTGFTIVIKYTWQQSEEDYKEAQGYFASMVQLRPLAMGRATHFEDGGLEGTEEGSTKWRMSAQDWFAEREDDWGEFEQRDRGAIDYGWLNEVFLEVYTEEIGNANHGWFREDGMLEFSKLADYIEKRKWDATAYEARAFF